MGEHQTWFHLLPGYSNLEAYASHFMARETFFVGFERTHFTLSHVVISASIVLVLFLLALRYAASVRADIEAGKASLKGQPNHEALIPHEKLGARNFFELIIDATLKMAVGVMGETQAKRFLPFIGTFVFFILLNNLIGLVPGFLPATDTLKTNLALSGIVLLVTHAVGVKTHGISYFKHFAGPIWFMVPLILPIELFSHFIIRPVSLALRLMGNMFADHKLLGTISLLMPLIVPLPFYVLGILVCVVQTLVFSLLVMIYVGESAALHEAH